MDCAVISACIFGQDIMTKITHEGSHGSVFQLIQKHDDLEELECSFVETYHVLQVGKIKPVDVSGTNEERLPLVVSSIERTFGREVASASPLLSFESERHTTINIFFYQ